MTADGSGDDKIQPEHTKGYSFAGAAPMELGADGKDEKKDETADEKERESESETDSEEEEFESDGEPDEKQKVKTLSEALPAGYKTTASLPALDASLVGKSVVFKWNVIGWANGVVTEMRRGKRASKYNFEITYPPDVVYPHKLGHAQYSTSNESAVGAWCVIVRE